MPQQLTPDEFNALSDPEKLEYNQRQVRDRKWCQRSFNCVPMMVQMAGSIATPGGGGQMPVTFTAKMLCEQEDCMNWDNKKRRCLDVSVAIAAAYGKPQALPSTGSGSSESPGAEGEAQQE